MGIRFTDSYPHQQRVVGSGLNEEDRVVERLIGSLLEGHLAAREFGYLADQAH